ncbi:MAG: hypothetical protein ACK5LC_16410 [Coprobacillaceae bacterium]
MAELKNNDSKLEFAGTLQIWRNQLVLVLNKGKKPRLEEIGTKYYIEFEEHRTIQNIPEYSNPDYLGYRINRENYPERIRRIVVFEGKYYYLSQKKEHSNETLLTFIPFGENEDEKEWKKFYLPKESREVIIYSENDL